MKKSPTKKKTSTVKRNAVPVAEPVPPKKTRRRKKKSESSPTMYFTPDTELAIVEYNNEENQTVRCKIYNERIRHAFEKIAENIFNTFKFPYNEVSPDSVQNEAVSHMVMNMSRYDPSKGKAFGYFSIVAKNWFILENNTNYRRFKKQVEIIDEPGKSSGEFIIQPEHVKQNRDNQEFIELMVEFWDENIENYFSKQRDIEIARAVIHIFRSCDRIDIFNKKALYLYIREIANCQTQHITKVVNRMLFTYRNIKDEYLNTGKITGNHFCSQNV